MQDISRTPKLTIQGQNIIKITFVPKEQKELERLEKAFAAEKARAQAMRKSGRRRLTLLKILFWACEAQKRAYQAGFRAGQKQQGGI